MRRRQVPSTHLQVRVPCSALEWGCDCKCVAEELCDEDGVEVVLEGAEAGFDTGDLGFLGTGPVQI